MRIYLYLRIALRTLWEVLPRVPVGQWGRFIVKATLMLFYFSHHRPIRISTGWKIHLYLPVYPSKAFFEAVYGKLIASPPRPVSAVFSITKACRYHCPHCYQRHDAGSDLPETTLLATADALITAGVRFLNVEGGEPFLCFERLYALQKHVGARAEIWVNTTGDGVDESTLVRLRDHGLGGIMVSIHAMQESEHDAFTGIVGSFACACRTLELAHSLGVPTAINVVLQQEAIRAGGIEQMIHLAADLKCAYIQLIHPKPAGLWLEHASELAKESANEVVQIAHRVHQRNNRIGGKGPVLSAQVYEESPKGFGCTAGGIDRLYVNATGAVQPCEFLNLSFGNVRETPLPEIFNRMREAFPAPQNQWACSQWGAAIQHYRIEHGITETPLDATHTEAFLKRVMRTQQPDFYRRLRIYPS